MREIFFLSQSFRCLIQVFRKIGLEIHGWNTVAPSWENGLIAFHTYQKLLQDKAQSQMPDMQKLNFVVFL